jgi:hypothetical protein
VLAAAAVAAVATLAVCQLAEKSRKGQYHTLALPWRHCLQVESVQKVEEPTATALAPGVTSFAMAACIMLAAIAASNQYLEPQLNETAPASEQVLRQPAARLPPLAQLPVVSVTCGVVRYHKDWPSWQWLQQLLYTSCQEK